MNFRIFLLSIFSILFSQNIESPFSAIPQGVAELLSSSAAVIPLGLFQLKNPAANKIHQQQIDFAYQNYVLDSYYASVNYRFPYEEYSLSLGVNALNSSNFEHRLVDGEKIGSYDNSALMLFASASKWIADSLSLGLNVKWNYLTLESYSSNYLLADIALLYSFNDRFNFGFTLNDISFSRIHLKNVDEKIDINYSLNLSYQLEHSPLELFTAIDNFFTKDEKNVLAGVAYHAKSQFSIVVSYEQMKAQNLSKREERRIFAGVSFGSVLHFQDYHFAIAYRELAILGSHLAFSLGKRFN